MERIQSKIRLRKTRQVVHYIRSTRPSALISLCLVVITCRSINSKCSHSPFPVILHDGLESTPTHTIKLQEAFQQLGALKQQDFQNPFLPQMGNSKAVQQTAFNSGL